jgi:putative membrane protein
VRASGLATAIRRWFDPSTAADSSADSSAADRGTVQDGQSTDDGGASPDYRFSLANERTFLAWIRTGLALIGGGLAVSALVPPLRVRGLREAIALVLLVLGAVVALRAVDHWARCEAAMRAGRPLPASRFPAVLAITIGAGAVLLIIAVAAGWSTG